VEGDEEWYFPIFAVVTVVWAVPLVTGFVLQPPPHVPNPLYIYGFYEAPGRWAERIRATAEAARSWQLRPSTKRSAGGPRRRETSI
jgi:hypothetical protein